jgi:hypothetical protein
MPRVVPNPVLLGVPIIGVQTISTFISDDLPDFTVFKLETRLTGDFTVLSAF